MTRFRAHWACVGLMVALSALLVFPRAALALEPDELALIVNRDVPEGRKLAEFYAQQRHVPGGRIIEISIPATNASEPPEQMTPQMYDGQVVPTVRKFLLDHHLERKVKCLVTFWGVPLRVIARDLSNEDRSEHARLETQLDRDVRPKIQQDITTLEGLARALDPTFKPAPGDSIQQLIARGTRAMNLALQKLEAMPEGQQRDLALDQLLAPAGRLTGADSLTLQMARPGLARLQAKPPTTQAVAQAEARLVELRKQLAALQSGPQNEQIRERMREHARSELGELAVAEMLQFQAAMLDVTQSDAAVDSELALLWWDQYPKAKWQLNPLYWRYGGRAWSPGPVLMVTRIDAPTEDLAKNMISISVLVEKTGLKGQAAIDARGRTGNDPYAGYDRTLVNLAKVVRQNGKIQLTFDDAEPVFPAHSLKNIAIYCGWYSLRNYIPPGQFNPGAVAYHVASFELMSLHNPGEKGWVRGLLNDGVAATLGAVNEPYLQSFPPADEFFSLLLTGKLTLAEVYWRTCPWASWMQTCIGDPLYRPYLHDPVFRVEDVPMPLRLVLEPPATQPTTRPVLP